MIFYITIIVNMPIPRYELKLLSQKTIATDVLEMRFSKPANFTFAAGQFIQIAVPRADKEILRSYSISSVPAAPYLEFCIKLVSNGVGSTYLQNLDTDDTMRIQGPVGRFTNSSPAPLSFVATGVGLAPIMGIITDELIHKKNAHPLNLLFGVRREVDIFWQERLDALCREYPNFSYTLTLSQPAETWAGARGRVTDHLTDHLIEHKVTSRHFLCGSPDMVKDVRTELLTKGVAASNLHLEAF